MTYVVHIGDCVDVLARLPSESVHAIVTDPPYGLSAEPDMADVLRHWLAGDDYQHRGSGFMGRSWDSFVPGPVVWREALRVLKPGGHLLAFFGTRTHDLGTLAIRLAGFEVRDTIAWLYSSGFPKSLSVSKAIDKAAGAERQDLGPSPRAEQQTAKHGTSVLGDFAGKPRLTAPATAEAEQWEGWGTALKPAFEPIVVARKPFSGTVAQNVTKHGTGALNIDGARLDWASPADRQEATAKNQHGDFGSGVRQNIVLNAETRPRGNYESEGRWPPNVAMDTDAAAMLDEQTGELTSGHLLPTHRRSAQRLGSSTYGNDDGGEFTTNGSSYGGDVGGASRFMYVPKATTPEREAGLEGMEQRDVFRGELPDNPRCRACGRERVARSSGSPACECTDPDWAPNRDTQRANHHPTVKPIALMRWLCRLVTPPETTYCPSCEVGCSNAVPPSPDGSVRAVRGDVRGGEPSGSDAEVLQPGVLVEMAGGDDAGSHDHEQGLRGSASAGTPERFAPGVRDGAPSRDGAEARPAADDERGRAPHQRREDGQPAEQPEGDEEGRSRPATEEGGASDPLSALPAGHRRAGPEVRCRTCGAELARRPGVVLDPFTGSGSTGCAAVLEGFDFIGVEQDAEYAAIAERRIAFWQEKPDHVTEQAAAAAAAKRRATEDAGQLGLLG